MLAKVTFLSCITMSDFTFSGYELAFFVTHSGLSRSAGHILSQCANLAATTSEYFIHKPHRLIAAETGYSQSTVVRAFREAVNKGILSVEIVIGDHRERRANLYRFTPSFLAFAQQAKNALIESKLKISSAATKVKAVLAKTLALFNFLSTPPCQNDTPSPCQDDVAIKNKKSKVKKTKRSVSGGAGTIRLKKLTSWIAETKAKADNLRLSKKRAQKHEFKQKVEAAARKYAYLKNKRSPDIGGVSNFDNLPHCMTVNEALNAVLAKNKDNEQWGIPAGFRG
ncbi:Replication protein repL [Escherichia coli]|uniref:MarR family transcriptional regulator n=1 Tax=Escherichia coli TaxID=562 RepID=UPI000CEC13F2|nr:helix-turn-helix domain-containing protein [Escherichia coli]EFG4358467.1 Replication protein repL [Escherichia coli]EFH2470878.1 Replication protein repL [Escherichia coli]EFN2012850.1 Replication protein repL [Escherichia coli]EFO0714607.1 Replication protein repL [Escherichia coli]EGO3672697.1 Replication protein repL [Escherichia coli]